MATPTSTQTIVSTTLPSLEYLPVPAISPSQDLFYRPLLLDDLDAYIWFLEKPLKSYGKCNPDYDLSYTYDPVQRLLQNSFSRGIHLVFFLNTGGYFEIIGEGGVYISSTNWPSMYWICENRDVKVEEIDWQKEIPTCIHNFWWSIPRKNAQILVDSASLLRDSQGRPQSNEQLYVHERSDIGILLPDSFFEYKMSHWTSWDRIPMLTTLPDLTYLHLPIPSSSRLVYRRLTHNDSEAFYSVRKQHFPMARLGCPFADQDIEQSRKFLTFYLTPGYHNFPVMIGIFLKGNNQLEGEGEMIGYLGVSLFRDRFPQLHYIIKEQYQRQKYGSESLATFLQYWASLPRKQVWLHMNPLPLDFPVDTSRATERLEAETAADNVLSQGLLRTSGFQRMVNEFSRYIIWHVNME
ncbi:GNAT domain-containing protein [Xylaria sp. FL1777]|nr:GNAT domain-containing protein [Xylaria sp. FL1777]